MNHFLQFLLFYDTTSDAYHAVFMHSVYIIQISIYVMCQCGCVRMYYACTSLRISIYVKKEGDLVDFIERRPEEVRCSSFGIGQ